MKLSSVLLSVFAVYILSLNSFWTSSILAADPVEIYIAQGIEKLNEGKFNEAIEVLNRALLLSPKNPEAIYYSGIAHTRIGELDRAEELFLRIIKNDESFASAYFELGRIYYIRSDCSRSINYLSTFISLSDDESSKAYAKELIDGCNEFERAAQAKKYNLHLSVGSQYDDNVILEPSNPLSPAERGSDGRVLANVNADADLFTWRENDTLWQRRKKVAVTLRADYSFYQSFHFDLNDFNVHYHKIKPYLILDISDVVKPSIGYSYEYTLLGGNRYSGVNTVYTEMSVREGEHLSTSIAYEYRTLRYWDSDLFISNSIRSGSQNTIGVKQNFQHEKINGDVHFYNDFNRADAAYWSFDGFRAGTNLTYRVVSPLFLTVQAEYNRSKFLDEYPSFQEKRKDEMQKYSIILAYRISEKFSVYASEDYTVNDSNLRPFDYTRNIVSLYVTVTIL
jgi:tetratricopeptide (TPR) repeat protein